jgi:hypothetical protein
VLEQHYLKLVSKKDAEDWFNIFPPEEKTYVEPVIRTQRPYRPGRKTWRQIAAARNATVKATKTKQQQPTEKEYVHA